MDNPVVSETCRAVVSAGGEALRFNFRGVGESTGTHDGGRGEVADLTAVVDSLRAERPRLPLFLAGYSFGAVVCLDLSSSDDTTMANVAGVLLLAPPVARYVGAAWSLGSLPAAVIFGEEDELTPEAELRSAVSRWGERVRIEAIAGVGHDLGTSSDPGPLRRALQSAVSALGGRHLA